MFLFLGSFLNLLLRLATLSLLRIIITWSWKKKKRMFGLLIRWTCYYSWKILFMDTKCLHICIFLRNYFLCWPNMEAYDLILILFLFIFLVVHDLITLYQFYNGWGALWHHILLYTSLEVWSFKDAVVQSALNKVWMVCWYWQRQKTYPFHVPKSYRLASLSLCWSHGF